MPAVSKAQQKFMGMVHAAQKGEEPASPEVAKAADSMSDKDAKDFASTSHKGLPDHVKEALKTKIREIVRGRMIDEMTGSDAAGDYATPYAFGKKGNEKAKGKKQAALTGYSVVNEAESTKVPNLKLSSIAPNVKVAGKENEKKAADVSGNAWRSHGWSSVTIRWLLELGVEGFPWRKNVGLHR